jgi:hypothetical protein
MNEREELEQQISEVLITESHAIPWTQSAVLEGGFFHANDRPLAQRLQCIGDLVYRGLAGNVHQPARYRVRTPELLRELPDADIMLA